MRQFKLGYLSQSDTHGFQYLDLMYHQKKKKSQVTGFTAITLYILARVSDQLNINARGWIWSKAKRNSCHLLRFSWLQNLYEISEDNFNTHFFATDYRIFFCQKNSNEC